MSTIQTPGPYLASEYAGLIDRLREGDQTVLEDLLRTFAPRIDALLRLRHPGLQPEDREEILIEALYRIWQARSHFDPQRGSFQAWFFSIAENYLKDRLKRKRHPERSCDPAELMDSELLGPCDPRFEDGPEPVDPSPQAKTLNSILEQLTDLEKRIILAHAHAGGEGQWAADLAEELAIDLGMAIRPGTIRVKRLRIHDKIRKKMQNL